MSRESLRTFNARAIAPVLRVTGFRFSKDYRWGTTLFHRAVYAVVGTVAANLLADEQQTSARPVPAD